MPLSTETCRRGVQSTLLLLFGALRGFFEHEYLCRSCPCDAPYHRGASQESSNRSGHSGGRPAHLGRRQAGIPLLGEAAKQMFTMQRTYDLLFALYFVVCLEIELRKSGCLKGMVQYLNHLIHSTKVTMAVMPAFLGLLPSVGGARFSAPIVDNASRV